jgi:hypothetical protein
MARTPRFTLPGVPRNRSFHMEITVSPYFYAIVYYHRYQHNLREAAGKNSATI